MTQTITGVRRALVTACGSLYAADTGADGQPVLVVPGGPGSYQPSAFVAVGIATRQPVTTPTMGTNRTRERPAQVDVGISVYYAGDETQIDAALAAADALVDKLDGYFRVAGNEVLGGSCRLALVTNIAGPDPVQIYDKASGSPTGWAANAVVTVTAIVRY